METELEEDINQLKQLAATIEKKGGTENSITQRKGRIL